MPWDPKDKKTAARIEKLKKEVPRIFEHMNMTRSEFERNAEYLFKKHFTNSKMNKKTPVYFSMQDLRTEPIDKHMAADPLGSFRYMKISDEGRKILAKSQGVTPQEVPKKFYTVLTSPNEFVLMHETGHAIDEKKHSISNPILRNKKLGLIAEFAGYAVPAAMTGASLASENKKTSVINMAVAPLTAAVIGASLPTVQYLKELRANKNAVKAYADMKNISEEDAKKTLVNKGMNDGLKSYRKSILARAIEPAIVGATHSSIAAFVKTAAQKSKKPKTPEIKFKPIIISSEKIKKSNKIRQSALSNYTVTLKYKDKKGNISTREIEPYKIVGDSVWGHDIAKNEIRHFKLPGIKSVKPTKNKYSPRWDIDVGEERTAALKSLLFEKLATSRLDKKIKQPKTTVRKIKKSDFEQVKTLLSQLSETDKKFLALKQKLPLIKQQIKNERHCYVVENKNKIVGFMRESGRPQGYSLLEEVVVHPKHRRQGLAQKMVNYYHEMYPKTLAKTNANNKGMINLLQSGGYNADNLNAKRIINWKRNPFV